ncbi:tRNA (adenine(22)-N(1))-methyltransferase [Jeotgalibacillus soli]|uniref:SAM-dependent methyltransferase n=1 Tax=Jeotgalibacillus soli TaxID=889306 RepID=A0A0C2R2C5_9BACL|nr:tRNA (adenine(22)-N(1))-methyltransferase TrmK [Jeotgalibacillus soli]KIL44430.1 hypothetical protein KP78_33940 [Jeotgalibacillus soli]
MNSNHLSDRLHAVASFIPKGSTMADIGSDHAYLPCFVVKQGIVQKAIAGEVVEGPFLSAKKQVEEDQLSDFIDVRKGNGLAVMEPGEVDVITIAGMGGPLIAQILEDGKNKLPGVKRLILQPNINAISIRDWLVPNEWKVIDEQILMEDGKIYEIIVAEPADQPITPYSPAERLLGPVLLNNRSNVFKEKWQQEYQQWERILNELQEAGNIERIKEKKKELEEKMTIVKEALKWKNR